MRDLISSSELEQDDNASAIMMKNRILIIISLIQKAERVYSAIAEQNYLGRINSLQGITSILPTESYPPTDAAFIEK